MVHQRLRRCVARGDDPSCFDHASQKALMTSRLRLLPSAPVRDLADGRADQYQQNGRLDVGAVDDRKLQVRSCEEDSN